MLIAFAMHVSGEDEQSLARLCRDVQHIIPEEAGMLGCPRVDMQAATAFAELTCLVKHAIFNVS